MRASLLCILILLMLLCGCTASETPYTIGDAQILLGADLFNGDMGPVDKVMVSRLYGVDEEIILDCICYMAANTASSADELTVFILTDENGARLAEEACQNRVKNQIKASRNYAPAAVSRLENAVIRRIRNTVLFAVGDPECLPEAVDGLHSVRRGLERS